MVEQVLDRLNRKALLEQAVPTQARWEWRTFGTQFGLAEKRLAGLTPNEIKESDEIYFISPIGENVKVRDGLMDVKILREVSPFGLEQWTPVMKAEFPLSAVDAQLMMLGTGKYTSRQIYGPLTPELQKQRDDYVFKKTGRRPAAGQ